MTVADPNKLHVKTGALVPLMKPIPSNLLRASMLALVPLALHAQIIARLDSLPAVAPNRIERLTGTPAGFDAFAPESSPRILPFDLGSETFKRNSLRPADDPSAQDYLIPRAGKSIATVLTGVPYATIAEYAYGITDRFSVGIIAGVLENFTPGYGVRFRYVVAQPNRDFRIHLRLPVIFYPQARSLGCPGCEAWFLAWPALNAEWRLPRGTRLWTGVGVVATACASTVFHTRNVEMERGGGIHEGMWDTLQLGFSKSISRRTSFQLEAAAVMRGTKLANKTWVGGPPVILTTGFSHPF